LQGDVRSAGQAYAQAIELSRGTNDLMAAIGLMRVAELHLLGGRLRRAANTYDQMQRLFPEPVPVYISGLVDYGWGELVVEPRLLLSGYVALARVLQAQGAGPAALRTIREALQVELDYGVTWTWGLPSPGAFEARLWLAQGNLDAAGRWADERPWSDEGAIPYRREVEILIVARVYLAQGRTAAAITLLDRLQVAAQENERTGRVLEILTLQALALQAQGHPARALKVLAEALALAEPEGYVRLFLDEGPPMARLLYQALENQIQPDYCGRLLQAVDLLSTADPRQRGDEPSLVESLSEREREVLALVAEGLTNREIAQRLVIAPGTVKVHTANIYGKLGVHSRIQAVAKARELGILPRR
jgi:LuxR family maltose regulon positive regulatory protein